MSRSLRGKRVLVTGASSGIGRACVLSLCREGARVVGLARSGDSLAVLREEAGDGFLPVVADVASGPSMAAACREILDREGVPDVVIANAGIGLDALFHEMTDEDLARVFEVNVFGVVRTVRPFLAAMKERGSGRVVIVSSIVGKRGTPHYAAYSGSKFALHGMADALRPELLGSGVSVGLVCPGSTETGFRANATSRGPRQNARRVRRHSAESVAGAVVDMARSDRRERLVGFETKLLVWANRISPGLVDRLLARALTTNR